MSRSSGLAIAVQRWSPPRDPHEMSSPVGDLRIEWVLISATLGSAAGGAVGYWIGFHSGSGLRSDRGPLRAMRQRELARGAKLVKRQVPVAVLFAPTWIVVFTTRAGQVPAVERDRCGQLDVHYRTGRLLDRSRNGARARGCQRGTACRGRHPRSGGGRLSRAPGARDMTGLRRRDPDRARGHHDRNHRGGATRSERARSRRIAQTESKRAIQPSQDAALVLIVIMALLVRLVLRTTGSDAPEPCSQSITR